MEINNFLLYLVSSLVLTKAHLVLDENTPSRVFDNELYQRVLDPEQCTRQLDHFQSLDGVALYGEFLDAGIRFPRGLFLFTVTDLGNYHQCLRIKEQVDDMSIEGKYALITIPLNQNLSLPWDWEDIIDGIFPWPNWTNVETMRFGNGIISDVQPFGLDRSNVNRINPFTDIEIRFGMCIPKVCTSMEWIAFNVFNVSLLNFEINEQFVRLPDDKPWVAADYISLGIFSFIGFLTICCTLYDINHLIILKKDPKTASIWGRMFSVYTNTKRLTTFTPNANALECLDGIRMISMLWVILGHAYSMHNFNANLREALEWLTSADAVWVSTGLFSVDTFFFIAGLLLVYTTVGKLSGKTLLKRLHLFYLNRMLRMFPLLAALVLLEASSFHRVADGPYWANVALNVQRCRTFWWSTLLHVQNYVNPEDRCVRHSWYIAIDIQLHIVSPLVLYWVLNKSRKGAWTAMISALLLILTASTIFNFFKDFPATNMTIPRLDEHDYYMNYYYMNTLTRGAPFFVGMITGYVLNMYKGKDIQLNMVFVLVSWIISLFLIASCFYMSFLVMEMDWDNQTVDNLFNSFMRTVWALGLSWLIFACVKGYGGPINWLLTLDIWKLPTRISYAMYLYHYPMMFVVAGTSIRPEFFSVGGRFYDFMALLMFTLVISFFVTVIIDAPFSILIKLAMEGGQRRRPPTKNEKQPKHELEKANGSLENNTVTKITFLEKEPNFEINGHSVRVNGALDNNDEMTVKNGGVDRSEEIGIGEPLPGKV